MEHEPLKAHLLKAELGQWVEPGEKGLKQGPQANISGLYWNSCA